MKYLLFLVILLSACGSNQQQKFTGTLAPQFTFEQLTGDYSRPGAGAEYWNGALQVSGIPDPQDYYRRFKWTDIQDYSTGAFTWTFFDQEIHNAIDKGCRFNFRVMGQYPGQGPNVGGSSLSYPLPVHNAMQAEPVYKDNRDTRSDFPGYNSWVPNWNAPSYRKAYNDMMDAVVAHLKSTTYKGIKLYDAVGYVDIGQFGATGEWTGYNLGTYKGHIPQNAVATPQALIQFIDDMVDRFPDKQLMICSGAVNGTAVSDSIAPPVGYHVFTTTNDIGHIGLRSDNLGETDPWIKDMRDNNTTIYQGKKFSDLIMNNYKVAPWMGEPYSCCTINYGKIQYWDFVRQIDAYHITSFGNGNLENSGNSTVQAEIRQGSAAAGARLTITGGTISGNTISLNWANTGNAPVYENWNVNYVLKSGKVIDTVRSSFNPRLFLGTGSSYDTLTVPAGTWDIYLVLTDPSGYRKPYPLGITGRLADGSYLIRTGVDIAKGSESSGNNNPPPDTTPVPPPVIQPPVDSAKPCDPVHDTVIIVKMVHDTLIKTVQLPAIHDTIPRVCPACPPVPQQRSVDKIIFDGKIWTLKYDDGSETEL